MCDKYPGVGVLGHYNKCTFSFVIRFHTVFFFFSMWLYYFVLSSACQHLVLSVSLALLMSWVFLRGTRHSKWYFTVSLICTAQWLMMLNFFCFLANPFYSLCKESPIKASVQFLIGWIVFLLSNCEISLLILDRRHFEYIVCKYFLPFSKHPFSFCCQFLSCAKAFKSDIVPFVYFCF